MEKKYQTFVIDFVLIDAFNTTLYILLKKKKKNYIIRSEEHTSELQSRP